MRRTLQFLFLSALATSAFGYERLHGPTERLFYEKAKSYGGYTLFGVGGQTFLIDMEGQVVHTWPIGTNPHLLDDGHILDAGGRDTGSYVNTPDAGYRRETYDKDTHTEPRQISRQVVWSYRSVNSHCFFSHIGSSAQHLPNGNTLICSDTKGHFSEVTPEGAPAWEYINPVTRDGAVKVLADVLPMTNSVFRAYRYSADDPALKGRDLAPSGSITERAAEGLDSQASPRRPGDRPPAAQNRRGKPWDTPLASSWHVRSSAAPRRCRVAPER